MRIPFAPMLATLSADVPRGAQWVFEEKYDGIRTLAAKRGSRVRLWSRTLQDLTRSFAPVADAVARLAPNDLAIDGEVVVLDPAGVSRFQLLQRRGAGGTLVYAVFDLLELEGRSQLREPLRARRALLERTLRPGSTGSAIVVSRRLTAGGAGALAHARAHGWEGVIAKDDGAPYEPGKRARSWLKVKVRRESECVIGGFTPPEGSRAEFGSLILGMYEGAKLRYVGRVGTGFTAVTLQDLAAKMRSLVTARPGFDPIPKVTRPTWVRPRLVAQIAFAEWTADGRLRHPAFLGLRTDKKPAEVRWQEREP